MIPAQFEYAAPTSLEEALALLRKNKDDAKLLAGGHSLLPMMKLRLAQPGLLIDLGKVSGLSYVREKDDGLAIGAMTTYHALEHDPLITGRVPILAEASGVVGDVQVRNRGTIGGAAAHADPAADLPAVLVALEATLTANNGRRERSVPADRFFKDSFLTALAETDVLTEIMVPALPKGAGAAYLKLPNLASRFAVVGVAAVVTLDNQGLCERVRIGVTGAGPNASRAKTAERYLEGKKPTEKNLATAAQRATRGIEFQADYHGSAEYREDMTRVFTQRALMEAVSRAG
jgi:carbon-monoxide dehydrogenase medium subunit